MAGTRTLPNKSKRGRHERPPVDPSSLIHLILAGGAMPSTAAAPSNLGMPGFGWRLSDQEVAQLVTFIRRSWGNSAPAAESAAAARIRGRIDADEAKAPNEKPPA
jgi:hypothetical protein